MITSLLLASLATAPALPQGSDAVSAARASIAQGPVAVSDGVLGASYPATANSGISAIPVPGYERLYELTITNTGTPWQESFLFQVPAVPASMDVPVLVVFHQFGVSHFDVSAHTGFLQEAAARGWYLVAPLGATQINFSSIDSQINTQVVLKWVLQFFNVDRERIYGVGFSMGGGNALNYGARHLDPDEAMFAAIVNHTGVISLRDTYLSDPAARPFLELLFGGSPSTKLFEYQRSSVADLDPMTQAVVPGADLSRNLAHVAMQTWHASNDPLTYLVNQNETLHSHLKGLGGDPELVVTPGSGHNWGTMDEAAACDFLAGEQLAIPAKGAALVDQDGPYLHMEVWQDAAGAFTPFRWQVRPDLNRFSIGMTENLKRVRVNTFANELDPTATLQVVLGTSDGLPDELTFTGYDQSPTEVTRDGSVAAIWIWSSTEKTVRIVEQDGGYHFWRIVP
jgi:poly(3-hydroxybutyrate) depolymerase